MTWIKGLFCSSGWIQGVRGGWSPSYSHGAPQSTPTPPTPEQFLTMNEEEEEEKERKGEEKRKMSSL